MNHQSTQREDANGKGKSYFESGGGSSSTSATSATSAGDVGAGKNAAHESGARETFQKVQEQTKKVVEQAERTTHDLLSGLKPHFAPIDELFRKTTVEHPYLVVLSAATATFMTGFLTRRRTALGAGMMLGFLAGCYLSTYSILARKDQ